MLRHAQKVFIMKNVLLLGLFVCGTSLAACFESSVTVDYIYTPQQICIESLQAELKPFSNSSVKVDAKIDQNDSLSTEKMISSGRELPNGHYEIRFPLTKKENDRGFCDEFFGYSIEVVAEINAKGQLIEIIDIDGYAEFTRDRCHDSPDYTDLNFSK